MLLDVGMSIKNRKLAIGNVDVLTLGLFQRESEIFLIHRNHAEIEHCRQAGAEPYGLRSSGSRGQCLQDQIDTGRNFDRE